MDKMVELNNNNEFINKTRMRNPSVISFSSASSCPSDDSSEDVSITTATTSTLSRRTSQEFKQQPKKIIEELHRPRSNSDGAVQCIPPNRTPFEVFPSLPDKVLKRMGLLGDEPRVRPSDEELEQKFVSLSLGFTIDAATLNDRSSRQKRYRDQTEKNLSSELEKLIQKANRIRCLCINAETTELLSALLEQIEIVRSAASHAISAFERYGAVQHEQRISEAVSLMIEHVNMLKQQRDAARRHLQYTKKVLQNTSIDGDSTTKQANSAIPNGRVLTKRRASIATVNQNVEKNTELRKIARRTSDLSLRATSLSRSSRPSRLEFGSDLLKIKEGMVDNEPIDQDEEESPNQSDDESLNQTEEPYSSPETKPKNLDANLRNRLMRRIRRFSRNLEDKYERWSENGALNEFFYYCAILCFIMGIVTMANILIEIEIAKRGSLMNLFFSI